MQSTDASHGWRLENEDGEVGGGIRWQTAEDGTTVRSLGLPDFGTKGFGLQISIFMGFGPLNFGLKSTKLRGKCTNSPNF